IAEILYNRGYRGVTEITNFLFSLKEREVYDARLLKDAVVAAERIIRAINYKEKILIAGDYDVDGVTSSSVMLMALWPLGAQVNYFLPNRARDGYGLSVQTVKRAASNNYKLIITVDNGISAYEAADEAARLGIDLIITDHHRPHGTLPKALAIVNPNQADCSYPYKYFAGVGVAFKLMELIYDMLGKTLPEKVLELVTLGTIADVVPLIGENRYLVREGLRAINQQHSYSLAVMAANNNLTRNTLTSLDLGFMIAPQINALGRLDDAREAVKFLVSSDQADIDKVGQLLKSMNEERKKIDRAIFEEIEMAIMNKQIDLDKNRLIMASHHAWPAGVIGLVAGKLMHQFGRPTILFHHDRKNGIVKGSCRSIPEFDIFNALTACKDLLHSFGGHSFAAGLKLHEKDLPELQTRIEKLITEQVDPFDLQPKITLDATLELGDMNGKLLNDLANLEPFGNRNPQPAFLIKQVSQLKKPQLLKDKHVKTTVFADGIIKPLLFFNRPELYRLLYEMEDKPFALAAHVITNEWQDRVNIELQGIDIAL
ncbi:single-stranded-DNA-specific exonuclease RecJ, partial [Candidatus Dependentiae bacterium]|nr:single-stranded-DNA-specific exonuclease RecJ [Candidatus Dependentiae bacterium]